MKNTLLAICITAVATVSATSATAEIFAFENKCKDWTDSRGNRLVNLETYQVKRYENINKQKNGQNEQSKNKEISSQSQ